MTDNRLNAGMLPETHLAARVAELEAEVERLKEALQAELAFAEGIAAELEIDAGETNFMVRVMPRGRMAATRTWADVHAASRAALRGDQMEAAK